MVIMGDVSNLKRNHDFLKEVCLKKTVTKIFGMVLAGVLVLSACQTPQTTLETQATEALPTSVQPSVTATPEPPKSLVICVGDEPLSLYLYGNNSRGMWSILEAIYDGPVDTVNFEPQPVILEDIPSITNGAALVATVPVLLGDLVQDSSGLVTPLLKDTTVFPAGCRDQACAITWDGESELQMEQLSLQYQLKEGIQWSDGTPLTMADSVYSYQLAGDPNTPVNRYYIERTAAYTALDELSLTWTGIPGYTTTHFEDLFWSPLPQHAWQSLSAVDLLTAPIANQTPLGWGPYQIENWVAGSHIELTRNPNYFRAAEGLPKFEKLVYRFLGAHADSNLKALEIQECDLIDSNVYLDEQLVEVVESSNLGLYRAYFAQGPEWEHLDFGITPASYDDGFQLETDRPDLFSDVRMRQAFAYCSNRESIANKYFVNRSIVPASFYPPTHPDFDATLTTIPFDPLQGAILLAEMGWIDDDDNPATARVAQGVPGVPDGTFLILDYVTTQAELRVAVSMDLATSLSQCGIEVVVRNVNPTELYAAGPDGVMFGRNFDLAQFTWQSGRDNPCFLYSGQQIPTAANLWVGANITGYQSDEYDAACRVLRTGISEDEAAFPEASRKVQRIFNEELPVLPLYYQLKIAASRSDFCGLETLDVSSRSILWSIENFGYADWCSVP